MDLLARYLDATGVDVEGRAADAALLARLLRGHLLTFPYETLGMALGDAYPLDPEACVERALAGRPGYCYTRNTAFAWVLEQLGFAVTRHLGTVTGRSKPEPGRVDGGHIALTVEIDGQRWLADGGLGAGPVAPTPLREGEFMDGAWVHRLERSPVPGARWRLVPDPRLGAFRCMDFCDEAAPHETFLPLHEQRRHVGAPGTPYFTVLLARPGSLRSVVGCAVSQATPDAAPELVPLRDVDEWAAAVAALGCRSLEGRDPADVAALHARLVREFDAFHGA